MGISRRELGALLLGGLAARSAPAPQFRPKLLVLVLLEQLRGDALDSVLPQLGSGGLRRLLEKGAFFPDCRHLASTFPATSVATLATGAWPSQHGIVAGLWYDRATKKTVAASEESLLATTLAAHFTDKDHRAYVVSLDAALGGIFAGDPAVKRYWMNDDGAFQTLGAQPDWLTNYNGQYPISLSHDQKWFAIGARPDAPPLRTLTYSPERPREFLALYRSSQFAQSAQVDFAKELIQREGIGQQKSTTDFLCLLLSSSSLLGYAEGGESELLPQMILQLDRRIETLLTYLGRTCGEDKFALVLAGGHGIPPRPKMEVLNRHLVGGENLAQSIEKSLAAQSLGHVERYLYPFLYLDTTGFRDPEPIRLQAAHAAMLNNGVAGYYTAGGACSTHDDWEKRYRNSFHATRSGDVMLSYRPEFIEEYGRGRGISYGSLYNYDVQVPLCFYGPPFLPGVNAAPVESIDLAPTLARVMGVGAPSSSMGRVLTEALAT